MTGRYMTAKIFFKRIKQIHYEMLALDETIKVLRAGYGSGGGDSDGVCVQRSKDQSQLENTVIKIGDLSDDLEEKERELARMLIKGVDMIESLPDSFDRSVMLTYYITNCTWDQTAEMLNVDRSTVGRSLLESLDALDAIYFDEDQF